MSSHLGRGEIPALELAANYPALGEQVRGAVVEKIDDEYGLDIPLLVVVNISFPEEVEKALEARSSMNMLGDLGRYQQYQLGKATPLAALGGGDAGNVLGIGMGLAMSHGLSPPATAPPQALAPPPLPTSLFFLAVGGKQEGPYPQEQVAAALA